jgi:hypothetical protein
LKEKNLKKLALYLLHCKKKVKTQKIGKKFEKFLTAATATIKNKDRFPLSWE